MCIVVGVVVVDGVIVVVGVVDVSVVIVDDTGVVFAHAFAVAVVIA